jgi:CRP-like cAMP-binding protein
METQTVRPRIVLASIPFFAEVLDGEEIDMLGGRVNPRAFPAGTVLIREDDDGDSMFVIVSGEVDVSVGDSSAGLGRVLARLGAGNIVGEMSLMTGARRSATVTAVSPVVALDVTKAAIEPILNAAPELVERFAVMLERRQAEIDRAYGKGKWSVFGLTRNDLVMAMQAFYGGTM